MAMAFNPSSPLQQGIMDDNGEMIQPVVYDRIMYANRRSRLLEGSDFIRGDLPYISLKIWDGFHHQFNLILILGKVL